ncbi:MAG: WD40 repeat domain-containing protein [Phycisphaerae bacterium]
MGGKHGLGRRHRLMQIINVSWWPNATPRRFRRRQRYTGQLCDAQTGVSLFERDVATKFRDNLAGLNADGSLVAFLEFEDERPVCRVFAPATGQEVRTLPLGDIKDAAGKSCALSPDGTRLMLYSETGATLWNLDTSVPVAGYEGQSPVSSSNLVRFSPKGGQVVFVAGNAARLIDARDGQEIAKLVGHTEMIADVAFSPDGSRIVTASHDQTLRIWDRADGQFLMLYREQESVAVHEGRVRLALRRLHLPRVKPRWDAAGGWCGGWPCADF